AEILREAVFPATMAAALSPSNQVEAGGYRVFLERIFEESGNPTDPIERMMIQQLALAHYRIGELHIEAANAKGTETTKLYTTATGKLLGEFRRLALALREYRSRPERKTEHGLRIRRAG